MKEINTYPYRNHYLIYTRKSTDDSDNQKNSISYQKSEAIKYAKAQRLPIAPVDIEDLCKSGIIAEKHTGFKENLNWKIGADGLVNYKIERPKFHQLVQMLYKGEYKGVIFLCWDRASRNKSDDSIIDKLLKHGVDIRFVQASYDKSSSGELHMDIDGMFARHYSRVISEKVSQTTHKLREEGVCTFRAPVGYLNLGDARNKPFDPKRAPVIKQLFEKYSQENISLQDLARWANGQGLTMVPARRHRTEKEMLSDEEINIEPVARPMTFKHLQKLLRNPFYMGLIKGNDGIMVKSSSHKPLISESLFKEVQEKLHSKRRSVSYDKKLVYPYRGVFRCARCQRVYTPYEQKGQIYYGAKCEQNCNNSFRSFNKPSIEYMVGEKMARMYFTENQIEQIKNAEHDYSALEIQLEREAESLERRKTKVQDDLAYLKDNKLTLLKSGVYSPEDYQKEELNLVKKLNSLNEVPKQVNLKEVLETALHFSELSKTVHITYLFGKTPQREEITSIMFSELNLFDYTLSYKGRNGFRIFESPFMALGAPKVWISEIVRNHHLIKTSISELEELVKNHSP